MRRRSKKEEEEEERRSGTNAGLPFTQDDVANLSSRQSSKNKEVVSTQQPSKRKILVDMTGRVRGDGRVYRKTLSSASPLMGRSGGSRPGRRRRAKADEGSVSRTSS